MRSDCRKKLGVEKTTKLIKVVGHHCVKKSKRRHNRRAKTGELWDDNDFETLKIDQYGIDISVLSNRETKVRVVCVWFEGWEKTTPKNIMRSLRPSY